eukprot:TRINITY_DN40095_c0_g1_i1.p1 TRINITY_DN40095_c0_g1~~TRINITY_DN40095_c0_g1_i1.p1  ORF type:complete len:1394 (-),score=272.13 TRINITY_DN40095_c0_g1_i1:62-4243(-)
MAASLPNGIDTSPFSVQASRPGAPSPPSLRRQLTLAPAGPPKLLLKGFPQWLLEADMHAGQLPMEESTPTEEEGNQVGETNQVTNQAGAQSSPRSSRPKFSKTLQARLQEELAPFLGGDQIQDPEVGDLSRFGRGVPVAHVSAAAERASNAYAEVGVVLDTSCDHWPKLKYISIQFDQEKLNGASQDSVDEDVVPKTPSRLTPRDWRDSADLWRKRLSSKLAKLHGMSDMTRRMLRIPTQRSMLDTDQPCPEDCDSAEERCILSCVPSAFAELLVEAASELVIREFGERFHAPPELMCNSQLRAQRTLDAAMKADPNSYEIQHRKLNVFSRDSQPTRGSTQELFFHWALQLWKAALERDASNNVSDDAFRRKVDEFAQLEVKYPGVPLLKIAISLPVMFFFKPAKKMMIGPVIWLALSRDLTHRNVLQIILSKWEKSVSQSYELWPAGQKHARNMCPILGMASTTEQVQLLLDRKAQPDQPARMNYLPHGTTLWTAVWRGARGGEHLINVLLERGASVHCKGFHPDGPPLAENPVICGVMKVAAVSGNLAIVKSLLKKGAKLKMELPDVFARAPANCVKVLARQCAKDHPELILGNELVSRADGHRLGMIFEEIAKDSAACDQLQNFAEASHKEPEGRSQLLKCITTLIRRSTRAAVIVFDDIFLNEPDVEDPQRNAVPSETVFEYDNLNTAYVKESKWIMPKAPLSRNTAATSDDERRSKLLHHGSFPSGRKRVAWQNELARVPRSHGESLKRCDRLSSKLMSLWTGHEQTEFCRIEVLRFPGMLDPSIMDALAALREDKRIQLLNESVVFQALVRHYWVSCALWYDVSDLLATVFQFVALFTWWRLNAALQEDNADENSISAGIAVCWGIFAAGVLVDWSSLLMMMISTVLSGYDRFPTQLALQCSTSLWLAMESWRAWSVTEKPATDYQSPLAFVLAFFLVMVAYEMRVFNPKNPFGISLGHNLLPIIKTAKMPQILTMMLLLTVVIAATWLAAAVAFSDIEGIGPALVRTWQTLVVGESSLFDVDDYQSTFPRYFIISLMFFFSNIIIMNIFINVTGEGYSQQMELFKGSFSNDRFEICNDVHREKSLYRIVVLVLFTLLFVASLVVSLSMGSMSQLLPLTVTYVIFLVFFLHQWSIVARYAPKVSKVHRMPDDEGQDVSVITLDGSPKGHEQIRLSGRRRQCTDPKCSRCCYLWVCTCQKVVMEEEEEDDKLSMKDLRDELEKMREYIKESLSSKSEDAGKADAKHSDDTSPVQELEMDKVKAETCTALVPRPTAPSPSPPMEEGPAPAEWLGVLLQPARLERHLERAAQWVHEKDILPGDILGGDGLAASPKEAYAYLEELIAHLGLSQAAAQRLRKVVRNARKRILHFYGMPTEDEPRDVMALDLE